MNRCIIALVMVSLNFVRLLVNFFVVVFFNFFLIFLFFVFKKVAEVIRFLMTTRATESINRKPLGDM